MAVTSPRRVAVVGAGIGGLALARALGELDTGVEEIVVFDRRAELKPGTGGGIQINGGAAVLARLGLGEQVKRAALPVRRILSRKSGGFELLDIDVASLVSAEPALVAADGTPQAFSIMRDALQRMLVDALPESASLQLGRRLESMSEDASGVELVFEDGTAERFDLVVGADGLSSRVRQHVEASHADADGRAGASPPTYSGIRVQFGVVPGGGSRPRGSEGEFHQWFGEGVYALTGSYGTGSADGTTSDMLAVVFADPAAAAGTGRPGGGRAPDENSNWDVSDVREECLRRLERAGLPEEIESRLLGAMETAGGGAGTLPQLVRDAFFLINGKLGVAAQVFVKGARPWV
ncbi:hypothetical protein Ctob_005866 [Chrysochromulina tobinii]|uniref:FAD-binding domain-containing protein n=1 Tax=Chrysochromulina tobinii TaxID=1460289 RepID=A0A0M0K4R9_9EUKA|nr:hypothetical protein Ctob_005866 [Chrysochromulina tobinii]|eukprot:KOO33804.1 hypothetical protein Ctob_005866 [Chrysochromulina sp. CCMP291]